MFYWIITHRDDSWLAGWLAVKFGCYVLTSQPEIEIRQVSVGNFLSPGPNSESSELCGDSPRSPWGAGGGLTKASLCYSVRLRSEINSCLPVVLALI